MASSSQRDGVNPLRPYYKASSVGEPLASSASASSAAVAAAAAQYSTSAGRGHHHHHAPPPRPSPPSAPSAARASAPATRYASRARDMFSELDYNDYLGGNGDSGEPSAAMQGIKGAVDGLLWKYGSVLIAQPFEVAKTLMQVRDTMGGAPEKDAADLHGVVVREVDRIERDPLEPRAHQRDGSYSIFEYQPPRLRDSDSENEETSYFAEPELVTPSPFANSGRQSRGRPHHRRNSSPASVATSSTSARKTSVAQAGGGHAGANSTLLLHQLEIRDPNSVTDFIGQLWQKEGPFGVWKGTNATFAYSVLQSLLENWSRGLMSAVFNVPDLGVADEIERMVDIASPHPWASIFVAGAAAVATGLALAPLDLVRTRLLITPNSRSPRRTLSLVRALPSYLCPSSLIVPTILHSLTHPLLTFSTPLVLRAQFMIDSQASPTAFSIAKFCASTVSLFIKLPLETVLRRGQAAVLLEQAAGATDGETTAPPPPSPLPAYGRSPSAGPPKPTAIGLETMVPIGRYNGVLSTMYHIVWEEGTREIVAKPTPPVPSTPGQKGNKQSSRKAKTGTAETVLIRGQGLDGLWRGWKVGWWGLIGLWTSSMVSRGGEGEF